MHWNCNSLWFKSSGSRKNVSITSNVQNPVAQFRSWNLRDAGLTCWLKVQNTTLICDSHALIAVRCLIVVPLPVSVRLRCVQTSQQILLSVTCTYQTQVVWRPFHVVFLACVCGDSNFELEIWESSENRFSHEQSQHKDIMIKDTRFHCFILHLFVHSFILVSSFYTHNFIWFSF